jgi:hypothetical protein
MAKKRKKNKQTEEERIIEFLKLNGAVEVTEEDIKKDPYLKESIEEDRKRYQEYLLFKKGKIKERTYE